jgi:hypothetical protein
MDGDKGVDAKGAKNGKKVRKGSKVGYTFSSRSSLITPHPAPST